MLKELKDLKRIKFFFHPLIFELLTYYRPAGGIVTQNTLKMSPSIRAPVGPPLTRTSILARVRGAAPHLPRHQRSRSDATVALPTHPSRPTHRRTPSAGGLAFQLFFRALSTLRGLRGAPDFPPLCRETRSLGQ